MVPRIPQAPSVHQSSRPCPRGSTSTGKHLLRQGLCQGCPCCCQGPGCREMPNGGRPWSGSVPGALKPWRAWPGGSCRLLCRAVPVRPGMVLAPSAPEGTAVPAGSPRLLVPVAFGTCHGAGRAPRLDCVPPAGAATRARARFTVRPAAWGSEVTQCRRGVREQGSHGFLMVKLKFRYCLCAWEEATSRQRVSKDGSASVGRGRTPTWAGDALGPQGLHARVRTQPPQEEAGAGREPLP